MVFLSGFGANSVLSFSSLITANAMPDWNFKQFNNLETI
jgi:hypothetical protein